MMRASHHLVTQSGGGSRQSLRPTCAHASTNWKPSQLKIGLRQSSSGSDTYVTLAPISQIGPQVEQERLVIPRLYQRETCRVMPRKPMENGEINCTLQQREPKLGRGCAVARAGNGTRRNAKPRQPALQGRSLVPHPRSESAKSARRLRGLATVCGAKPEPQRPCRARSVSTGWNTRRSKPLRKPLDVIGGQFLHSQASRGSRREPYWVLLASRPSSIRRRAASARGGKSGCWRRHSSISSPSSGGNRSSNRVGLRSMG